MTDLVVVEQGTEWFRLKALMLDSVSSPITRRVYNMALDEFINWYRQEPRPGFSKATVSAWRVSLEARGLGSSSIIARMSAIRKLAVEASDNGLLAPEMAAGICRVKSAKTKGVRMGNWLTLQQAQTLLSTPNIGTVKGLRDRAILATLLGCGLRRSEVAALSFAHVQQRDGRWCILDLVGKHGRVRTVPMPASGRVYETCPAAFGPETLVHALHDFLLAAASPGRHLRVPVLLSGKADLTWCWMTIAKYYAHKRQALNLPARCALLVNTWLQTQRPTKKTSWAQLPNTISEPPELNLLGCHPEDDEAT